MIAGGAIMTTDFAIYLCVISYLGIKLIGSEDKNFEWLYLIEHCLVTHI